MANAQVTVATGMRVQPVVLSGGSGTRLWPLSREKYPKQLLPLIGDDSLLQATVRRTEGIGAALAAPMVVCNEEYRFVIAEQLRLMGKPGTIVLEPAGRNTAPALTLAALVAAADDAHDPVLLVMPADHVILDTGAFRSAVQHGARLAAQGMVVTFGITPDAPETGYGYIQTGELLPSDDQTGATPAADANPARLIARFVEKPDLRPRRPTWTRAPTCGTAASSCCARRSGWRPSAAAEPTSCAPARSPGTGSCATAILRAWARRPLPPARPIRSTMR